VVGVPDPKWGEVGKAFVVLKREQSLTAESLKQHIGFHLAGYKVPRHIEFRDQLPILAAGKILKRVLVGESTEEAEPQP